MLEPHFVTERELSEIASLANELICQRCRNNKVFLRRLVRSYLGSAEAAEDAVLERCARDPAYLESVAKNYVASLDERELLDVLRGSAGAADVVERLGFDPFDDNRKEAYRLAQRFVNQRGQWIVLAVGGAVFCLMCLFPPWQMQRWQKGQVVIPFFCEQRDTKLEVRFAGYHFAFADLPAGNAASPQGADRGTYIIHRWYWEMQLLQWLGLVVVLVAACAALRDRRSFEERIAALGAADTGTGPAGQEKANQQETE